ncbi:MAG: hypothetical protein SF339_13030 [Blastocatellia bacterium]|nr:hypothetical protein [Blastocatellia bacterium]
MAEKNCGQAGRRRVKASRDDPQLVSGRNRQILRRIVIQLPQRERADPRGKRNHRSRRMQASPGAFVDQRQRPRAGLDRDNDILQSVAPVHFSRRHCRHAAGQMDLIGQAQAAFSVSRKEEEPIAAARRRRYIDMPIPIEIARAEKLRRLRRRVRQRRRKKGRIGERSSQAPLFGLRRIRIDRVHIAAQQRDHAPARRCISADEVGDAVLIQIRRREREQLRLLLPQ